VIEAGDGSAAVDVIRGQKSRIDILFLDITLPGIPSREVLGEATRLRPEMRVIVTSAYGEEMASASLRAKLDRFIRKPYKFGDLTNLIRQALT
jgi:DNA-binding NtrC family response regulator